MMCRTVYNRFPLVLRLCGSKFCVRSGARSAPSDTSYGDGEVLEGPLPAQVCGALSHSAELVKLRPGDILLLDNCFTERGRMADRGVRQHHVAFSKVREVDRVLSWRPPKPIGDSA